MFTPKKKFQFGTSSKNQTKTRSILSPSEASPFSRSMESLAMGTTLHDSIIAPTITKGLTHSESFSQPRTPSVRPETAGGLHRCKRSLSFCGTGHRSSGHHEKPPGESGLIGSPKSSTMKEIEESIKNLTRENFNLKLRIYFMNEQLARLDSPQIASGGQHTSTHFIQTNIDLKVKCECLLRDLNEQRNLLVEANSIIEKQEQAMQRSNERKLQRFQEPEGSVRTRHSLAVDEDERLLMELEAEISGGQSTCVGGGGGSLHTVVEETKQEDMARKVEDLEQQVENFAIIVRDTELCLQQAQEQTNKVLEEKKILEKQLSLDQQEISELTMKINVQNDKYVKLEVSLEKARVNEEERCLALESEVNTLKEDIFSHKKFTNLLEMERNELLRKNQILTDKVTSYGMKCGSSFKERSALSSGLNVPIENVEDSQLESQERNNFIVLKNKKIKSCSLADLQVVTQTLHIPPTCSFESVQSYKEIKELRQCLKNCCQEKRFLTDQVERLSASLKFTLKKMESNEGANTEEGVCRNKSCHVYRQNLLEEIIKLEEINSLLSTLHNNSTNHLPDPSLYNETFEEGIELHDNVADERNILISDQARLIEEYRQEIIRLRAFIDEPPKITTAINTKDSQRRKTQFRSDDHSRLRVLIDKMTAGTNQDELLEGEDEDSWSEPDLLTSRKRMGLLGQYGPPFDELTDTDCCYKESRTVAKTSSRSTQSCGGSMSCLASTLLPLMSRVSHELEVSQTFDSGHESATETEHHNEAVGGFNVSPQNTGINACIECNRVVTKEIVEILCRCGYLMQCCSLMLNRFRRICSQTKDKLANETKKHFRLVRSLKDSVGEWRTSYEALQSELLIKSENVESLTAEASLLQQKLNKNFRLVADLSSENLKLSSEKMKKASSISAGNESNFSAAFFRSQQQIKQKLKENQENQDRCNTKVSFTDDTSSSLDWLVSSSTSLEDYYLQPPRKTEPDVITISTNTQPETADTSSLKSRESDSCRNQFYVTSPDLGVDLGSDGAASFNNFVPQKNKDDRKS